MRKVLDVVLLALWWFDLNMAHWLCRPFSDICQNPLQLKQNKPPASVRDKSPPHAITTTDSIQNVSVSFLDQASVWHTNSSNKAQTVVFCSISQWTPSESSVKTLQLGKSWSTFWRWCVHLEQGQPRSLQVPALFLKWPEFGTLTKAAEGSTVSECFPPCRSLPRSRPFHHRPWCRCWSGADRSTWPASNALGWCWGRR